MRAALLIFCALIIVAQAGENAPLRIRDELQLFVDDYFIESLENAELRMHSPSPQGKAIAFDQPWEGNVSAYITVLKDGDRFRMYYRGWSLPEYVNASGVAAGQTLQAKNDASVCYAESADGIHWKKPPLGIVEFNGSKQNNIVWRGDGSHNFMPFVDTKPGVLKEERYKAVGGDRALYGFRSADGLRWEMIRKEPVITDGAFDSQNVVFFDTRLGKYVAIYRDFLQGIRTLKRAESTDFLNWTPGVWADYGSSPREQLYTNATQPYFRAPQVYVAFPKRFVPWRKPLGDVPGAGISEAVFMTSRDGVHWDRRFMEAFIRPGMDKRDWVHRTNMVATGVVPTGPAEISIYAQRHYNFPSAFLERMALRTDGFVSVHAGYKEGRMTTKAFILDGSSMVLNFSTSAAGGIRYEIIDSNGNALPGFGADETPILYGDDIERVVPIPQGRSRDREKLSAQPVRIRFILKDADLYSIQIRD
jgi:hypothetical protein